MSLFDKIQGRLKQEASTPSLARVKYQDIYFASSLNNRDVPANAPPRARLTLSTLSENETVDLAQEVFPRAHVRRYNVVPSGCVYQDCPAAGYWDGHGKEAWCFYEAVFMGKATKPQLARDRQISCPRRENDG